MQFGAALRILRIDAGISLTELAKRIGVSPAYVSRVEHGHDAAPTPDRVTAIARALDVPPLVLLEIAQGAGTALASYLERVPEASVLFMEMARRDFGPAEIARIKAYVDRELPRREGPARHPRLGELVTSERVMLQVVADDLEEVIALAAMRLSKDRATARILAGRILEREAESPSLLGKGVVAPHAVVSGVAAAAAIVTLARPLKLETPDGVPVRTVVVLVSPAGGRRHVQLLAHVARLAVRGLSDVLGDLKSPERALGRLEALDVS